MKPIYRSNGNKIYTEFMEPIEEESKNKSAYRLGNSIYKYLPNTTEKQFNWIKYLISISNHYQHTLFPIDYFTDENNNFKGIILKDIYNHSSFSALTTSCFYSNIQEIKQEFYQFKQDGILPIDTGYHNSKVENTQIYLFDTDEFQPNTNYEYQSYFNHYVYDLLKNIVFQQCQTIPETKLINQYFEQTKIENLSFQYIEEVVLNYPTMEEFAINIKEEQIKNNNTKKNRM